MQLLEMICRDFIYLLPSSLLEEGDENWKKIIHIYYVLYIYIYIYPEKATIYFSPIEEPQSIYTIT